MSETGEYKRTFMDRHGPDTGHILMAWAYGIMVFGLVFGVINSQVGFTFVGFIAAICSGVVTAAIGLYFGTAAGHTMKRFTMGGDTTPYVEQYSYQQALVMKGQVDEALESFEAVIAEKPDAIDARIKAAELYVKERQNFARAAELFREVERIPTVNVGQFVYVSNRVVDLYTGPLNEPGKALVVLRKLIDKYPGSTAAENAKAALATLKARHHTNDG